MPTYDFEYELPALPVPDLEDSCAQVLELVAPLVDAGTLGRTREALENFARPGGAGQLLQGELLRYRKRFLGNDSWLRPLWDDMYLAWRQPLPVHLNYVFALDGARWGGRRALPRLLRALARVFRLAGAGRLEAEMAGPTPQSMEQLPHCLYTRIPGRGADLLRPIPLVGAQRVAVVCGGRWFTLPLCDEMGRLAGEDDLAGALDGIRYLAGQGVSSGGKAGGGTLPTSLGALTTTGRELAAELREALLMNRQNRLSLAEIESAALVVCLDGSRANEEEMLMSLLCGPAQNRFFDKSLQVISSANHGLGVNFEHSGCDAGIWLYLLSCADELLTGDDLRIEPMPGVKARALHWDIPPALEERLAALAEDFAQTENSLSLACRRYPEFSRTALKALGSSPDAFIQLSFQLACYRLYGKLRSTYEAVSVRSFAQGRTEAGRPVTSAALEWARAMDSGLSNTDLLALYRKAEAAHKAVLARSQAGQGAERHFAGLAAMYEMRQAALGLADNPAIFSDPGWLALKHDAVSTSGIGAPFIRYFCFGPVVEDGLGLGYSPCVENFSLSVTGYLDKSPAAGAFALEFERAAQSLAALLAGKES